MLLASACGGSQLAAAAAATAASAVRHSTTSTSTSTSFSLPSASRARAPRLLLPTAAGARRPTLRALPTHRYGPASPYCMLTVQERRSE